MKLFLFFLLLTTTRTASVNAQAVQKIPNPPISGNGSIEQIAQCFSNFRSLNKKRFDSLDAMVRKVEEYRIKGFNQLREAKEAEVKKLRRSLISGLANCNK
jgi:hypothetical protein